MPLPASYLQNFVSQIMKPIEYFPGPSAFPLSKEGAYPVRSTVEAKLAFGVAVEIEAQAYSPVQ